MLAVESGAPAVRRRRPAGRASAAIAAGSSAVDGPGRRARAASGSTATMTALAAAFERIIADAPEQWWAVFFPIWPDLEEARAHDRRPPDPVARRAAPTCTSTRVASDGTADVDRRSSTTSARGGDARRHRDHRPRAHRRRAGRPGDGARPRPARSRSSSARRSRRSAATCSRCSWRRRSGRTARCATTIAAIHDAGRPRHPGPPAGAVPAVRPGLGRSGGCSTTRDPRVHPDALETFNPTALGRPWHDRVVRFADEHGLAPRRQQRRPRPRRHRARLDRRSRAGPPPTCAAPIAAGTTGHHGSFHGDHRPARRRSASSSRKRGRDARDELVGRLRRDGTGRDHGYPGGRARPPRFDAEPADEDRPRLPVHLPGGRRRRPARPVPVREPAPRAATTSGSSPPATARSARRRATSSASASASRCRPTARSAR